MENKYFTKALSNFTHDMASGGAIRHLADLGYTVDEIAKRLEFPTPLERIRETVWKHLLDKGIILLEDPESVAYTEKVTYVKSYGSYGKTSFKRVVEKQEKPGGEYICCDFGKRIIKDKKAFEKELQKLEPKDRAYVIGLPWPPQPVYHLADERMIRITKQLSDN